ncbi:sensor histidine kinase [Runella sp.]|uniref:sensor histidine kinase n=1 Tax=Runella sp. TaxID=1960881 RepID=UPI003D0EC463
MKIFFSSFLFVGISLVCCGQNPLPPIYEIKSDTAFLQHFSADQWQMLEDKDGKLTLNEVLHSGHRFHYRGAKTPTDTVSQTYWFWYRLKNTMNREARVSLNSVSDYDDFYVSQPNKTWKHLRSGLMNNWQQKDGLKIADAVPLVLQPQEELTVYQRVKNKKPGLSSDFSIALAGTDRVIKRYYIDTGDSRTSIYNSSHLKEAFMMGFLLITAIFNLFFFFTVRERMYLYFALFLLFLAFNRATNIFFAYANLGNRELRIYSPFFYGAWIFITFFLAQFFRHALKTFSSYPKWDTFFISLAAFLSFNQLLTIIRQFVWAKAISLLPDTKIQLHGALLFSSLLITLLLFVKRRDRFYITFLIASLPYILLNIIFSVPVFRILLVGDFRSLELGCIFWLVVLFAFNLFERYNDLQKENAQKSIDNERLAKEKEIERNQLIAAQNETLEREVAKRTAELEQSLADLKTTQNQLIQSEKLASLGELTAGIAHEIQNPLNFVNNFSEVSAELVEEMQEELTKGDPEEAKAIADDVRLNLQKINHHGKRASSIVKGMLEHSKASTGVKELTDINALVDEYLRLSYHGLKAKDNGFNVHLATDFDPDLPKTAVIPQDMGRVLLNLINNAFYAVNQRAKQGIPNYQPKVTVSSKVLPQRGGLGGVEITVKDNGTGMSAATKAKIFQPFFTTKPTGEGTGLGLSLAYDIVTKGHGGTLDVESTEGEGTTFTIKLPIG